MAGRDISVTHEALGTVRVMKTGGMIGEVVGKAASICLKNQCTPRDVYTRYFGELKELLALRGAARRETLDAPIVLPIGLAAPAPQKDLQAAVALNTLPGLVLDDSKAILTGPWTQGSGLPDYIEAGYRYRAGKETGAARYSFKIPKAGKYEVRLNYGQHENRATMVLVSIESAEGLKQVTINQRNKAPLPRGFISLGSCLFEVEKPAVVTIGGAAADGFIHADVVQLLPLE